MSIFRLCRAFKAAAGTTIHRYITQLRLRNALVRLLDGDTDVGQVAFDCGFGSHSHCTLLFRLHFGVTPSSARLGSPVGQGAIRSRR